LFTKIFDTASAISSAVTSGMETSLGRRAFRSGFIETGSGMTFTESVILYVNEIFTDGRRD